MKIGIISDSHDNVPMIRAAVSVFIDAQVSIILHAGDIISPFAAKELMTAAIPVRAVFGNNDGDQARLPEFFEHIHPAPQKFTLAGKKFLLTHDRDPLTETDLEGIDILIFGHTHYYQTEPGPPFAINPGEAGGWITGDPTVAILDTETMEVSKIRLS